MLLMMCTMMCATFTACSDDDEPGSALIGKWKMTDGEDWEIWNFQSGGKMTCTYSYDDVVENHKYSVSGDKLRVDFYADGKVDDYAEGTYSVTGDKLTYTCHWYDGDGKWGPEAGEAPDVCVFTKVK